MMNNRFLSSAVLSILLFLSAGSLYAQKKQQPAPEKLNDAQVTERLSYLENALYTAQPHAQGWRSTAPQP